MFSRRFRIFYATALICLSAALVLPGRLVAAGDLLCSTFPMYLFTKNITEGRDAFDVRLMVSASKGCPHDYAPTPSELEALSRANVLIINGLGLESFLSQALKVAKPDIRIVDASGHGLEDAAHDDHAEPGAAAGPPDLFLARGDLMGKPAGLHHHDHDGPNPHLFAAPSGAACQVNRIAEALAQLDPDGAETYRANAARFTEDLRRLLNAFAEAGPKFGRPKVLVSHGVFDFLAGDLGLEIVGEIEEEDGVDPSAARLAQLVELAKEREVRAILVDPQGNVDLATALGAELKVPVAVIDPAASGPEDPPLDYYQGVMLTDLEVLTKLFAVPAAAPAKGKK